MKKKLVLIGTIFMLLIPANIFAEYVFYLEEPGGVINTISESVHQKIYPILLKYQFPMCIYNNNLLNEVGQDEKDQYHYKEEKHIRRNVQNLQKTGELLPSLKIFYIPKTLYELHFILYFLNSLLEHATDSNLPKLGFPLGYEQFKQKYGDFKVAYKDIRTVGNDNTVRLAHFHLNNKIIEQGKNKEVRDLVPLIEQKQEEFKNVYETLKLLYQLREVKTFGHPAEQQAELITNIQSKADTLPSSLREKIMECLKSILSNRTDCNPLLGTTDWARKRQHSIYSRIAGIDELERDPLTGSTSNLAIRLNEDILTECVKCERRAHELGNWILYRGGILAEGEVEKLTKDGCPYSLSFGNSLFAGIIWETSSKGAMAYQYLEERGGYGLKINMMDYLIKGLPYRLFFIPPFPTVLSFYLKGEHFHPRGKVFFQDEEWAPLEAIMAKAQRFAQMLRQPDWQQDGLDPSTYKFSDYIKGFEGIVHWPFDYIRADLNYFDDRQDFERKMYEYFLIHRTLTILRKI